MGKKGESGNKVGRKQEYGSRFGLRFRFGVLESLERSYGEFGMVGVGGGKESFNSYLNRILFDKSEEMLMMSRRVRDIKENSERVKEGESEVERRIRRLRGELGTNG